MEKPKVAVIGGGISGLVCVFKLLELKEQNKKDFEVLLFEKEMRLGGTIETLEKDGFTLERGPDSFISEKPWGVELCNKLGIQNEIIGTRNENRKSFIVRRKKLIPLPEGFYLVAPTQMKAFLRTPLFSFPGKLRMMMEPMVPRNSSDADESVACFLRRRFGNEALERVGQPMLAGIYTGDPETLSMTATMPRFRELEKKYGSVLKGLLQAAENKSEKLKEAGGPRYSLFLSFKRGMETLTRALAARLPQGTARLGAGIKEISRDKFSGPWRIVLATGQISVADAVCLTTSARSAAGFLNNTSQSLSKKLGFITYESVATVNLAYRRDPITHTLDGFGFVVPRTEESVLVACSFSSQKYDFRAPEGAVLLRAFVGGAFGREFFNRDDGELLDKVKKELAELLGIKAEPLFTVLRRYPDSMVQYRVGHLELVREIEAECEKLPGLFLTGSSYRGVGIPDCIHDAERTAARILDYLNRL